MPIDSRKKGGALLAVLWLSAALSAIAFTVASTVRGEIERASTAADGTRGYFLAKGALERAMLYMQWGPQSLGPDGVSRYYTPGTPLLRLPFPGGETLVEILPEAGKLNINTAQPEMLFRLLVSLGLAPDQARETTLAVVDWRSGSSETLTVFDQHYLSLTPSFRSRHASIEETEELLLVRGITPELYYGTYQRDAEGRLRPLGGLKDCVSVYGATDRFDVNTARPALLAALGLSPEVVDAIVEMRRRAPIRQQQLSALAQAGGAAFQRLRVGGGTTFTLRATARPRLVNGQLSDLRRTVAALVKFGSGGSDQPFHILRWYDQATTDIDW